MKIAFNAIRVSNKAGSGFDTFIINFVNEFARQVYSSSKDIEFDVYTLYPQHFPEVKPENIKRVKFPFVSKSAGAKSEVGITERKNFFALVRKRIVAVFADYFRMLWTQLIFPFRIKKYDLVIALTEYEGMLFNRKQLIVIHNTVPFLFPEFPAKYRFYTYNLLPQIVRRCQKIITVSDILKEEISGIFKIDLQKIYVIYEGVDRKKFYSANRQEVEIFKKQHQIESDYILAVGHSNPMKNFSGVLAAFSLVKEKRKTNLVIAGYIDKEIKIPEGVKYIGHIPNDHLYLLYSGAKCFVFPTFHEGFGLPPLEAMACGCPAVVSNKGSLPEVCGEAAVYVNPDKPESIADGILKILSDENLRQELIKKGYQQIERFSWAKAVREFIQCLKSN